MQLQNDFERNSIKSENLLHDHNVDACHSFKEISFLKIMTIMRRSKLDIQ